MNFESASKYKKQIKKLYRTAFPANERAPLFMLHGKTKHSNNSFCAITDNNEFVGLVYTISNDKWIYVFFLAVEESMRGKGYGTSILKHIQDENLGKTVALMIEDTSDKAVSNYEERIQRLKFYQNNGFKQLNIKINEAGVDYELLGTNTNVTQQDFLNLMREFLGSKLLHKYLYRKMNIQ